MPCPEPVTEQLVREADARHSPDSLCREVGMAQDGKQEFQGFGAKQTLTTLGSTEEADMPCPMGCES